jgi:hypothetical protein
MQLNMFESEDAFNADPAECISWLRHSGFDIRQRFYETKQYHDLRARMSVYAFTVGYSEPKWMPLENFADICPKGLANRLPQNKKQLPEHDCYFLKMDSIRPENWLTPSDLLCESAQELPARATYMAAIGDILLSRFKEPLGKCVIYDGNLSPLYVSSNFILLRPKSNIHPLVLLAVLKSSFLAYQLHKIIRRGTVITEMFKKDALRIRLPNLVPQAQEKILELAEKRATTELNLGSITRALKDQWDGSNNHESALEIMNRTDAQVNSIIKDFIEQN